MAAHKIAVLGAGNGGQALAGHLAMRGHDVSLYDIDREKIRALQSRGQIRTLGALAWLVYFFSYVTRINFAAILVAFTQAENVSNAAASVITSVLFVTYGVGQLISGYLGDRIPPNKLIFGGLLTSVVCNVLMPQFSPNIPAMAAIWGVNGLAQAFMWPPLVKI